MKKAFYFLSILFLFLFQTHIKAQGWSELGGVNSLGVGVGINSICSDPSGNIYAPVHVVDNSGEVPVLEIYVAKYNGSIWSQLGGSNGLTFLGIIQTICSDPSGNIYATGGSSLTTNVSKYNGTTWSEFGGLNNQILSICSDASGNIYAAGYFTNDSGYEYVAKFNGTTWSELGGQNSLRANSYITSIACDASGNIYVAGGFTNGPTRFSGALYVAKYNGTVWSELGGFNSLSLSSNNDYYIINSICSDSAGNIYATGGSSPITNVSKYNGTTWSQLAGLNANNDINSICSDPSGNIYAGGNFTDSSNNTYIAKFNGAAWSELGGSLSGGIVSICTDLYGNIYAAGGLQNSSNNGYVAKYGGTAGINEIAQTNSIELFPNPANNQLTIRTPSFHNEVVTVSVMNVLGEVMQEEKTMWSNDIDINIKNLPAGICFLEMKSESGSLVKKFVKE